MTVPSDVMADKALKLMKEHGVSQVPVFDENECVGAIIEEQVLDLVVSHKDPRQVSVREIMRKPFPIVAADVSIEEVAALLKAGHPSVLVRDTVGNLGILTKYDLVAQIAGK